MWDLTIITKWAEATHDMTDPQILQRRALILTMIFGVLSPAELERMRRETTKLKDYTILTQVQTKTSGRETVKVIIYTHPNSRIDAAGELQRWLEFTKTIFQNEQVWSDIEGSGPSNLQRIKEEQTAILRENGIPETFTGNSIRHAVITHLARQEGADWKAINAYARLASGSRVAQEYYTELPVQDTRWILETICGPVPLVGNGDKLEKDSEKENIRNENTESGITEYSGESLQAGGEVEVSKRKRSKRRGTIRDKSLRHESEIAEQPERWGTPFIVPSSESELTGEKDPTPLKRRGKDRKRRSGRSI
ncbi:uncharacterized protein MONOS_16167 [Monocercomonoides exilis]|uniref:uncharacterized protein n=1 Tax=Monocercomonoides exilis TaxID=2049356 RepID=UPI003559CB90|nr:hypothetical protein MONOS_16167 [Monocercomonoides exilis]|eukprot:MONOS_16167.1-p1 / transcript=MONOS_16167.1 / gene=MONOS_16167 / organism=Monocercomonoides_exilis_PA203 / gene_product=unspecified product / transcript_product=unspecified product / location=Mono_scaffold01536:212-1135(-) / protein_length=308 / sequence_SO=supercontig / SO=protein_coding / is_pseudo=false